jgi:hypothetical protein
MQYATKYSGSTNDMEDADVLDAPSSPIKITQSQILFYLKPFFPDADKRYIIPAMGGLFERAHSFFSIKGCH